jgi:hypothetical protein
MCGSDTDAMISLQSRLLNTSRSRAVLEIETDESLPTLTNLHRRLCSLGAKLVSSEGRAVNGFLRARLYVANQDDTPLSPGIFDLIHAHACEALKPDLVYPPANEAELAVAG